MEWEHIREPSHSAYEAYSAHHALGRVYYEPWDFPRKFQHEGGCKCINDLPPFTLQILSL